MMNINEKVKIILENISEIEIKQNIDNIFLREELQLSSLDMLWIIVDIEKEFNVDNQSFRELKEGEKLLIFKESMSIL